LISLSLLTTSHPSLFQQTQVQSSYTELKYYQLAHG